MSYQGPEDPAHHEDLPPVGPPADFPPVDPPPGVGAQPPPVGAGQWGGPPQGAMPPAYGAGPGGYPPPGYAPYGYPPPGYQMPIEHPQGTTILILGILSVVVCALVAPVAWVMGSKALKEIDANPAAYSNRSNVQVGRVLGIIFTVIGVGYMLFLGFFITLLFAGASSGA